MVQNSPHEYFTLYRSLRDAHTPCKMNYNHIQDEIYQLLYNPKVVDANCENSIQHITYKEIFKFQHIVE
ncbi:hypothetical protein POVCU2_0066140 [Plasmodium ovale curtisi]|uniref:Uncharacterized protein n=1 Tax=Plasmodium ovale curtisi TaxID=864141 RepID=A0A1A8X8R3_PLAOA|nr:hypothetical protein POVCU2_0066140 [Plasmodium ovale curtisi]SBT00988.1 hypothetical protein POVCU1_063810 [Plasmodium ovale curtisi]